MQSDDQDCILVFMVFFLQIHMSAIFIHIAVLKRPRSNSFSSVRYIQHSLVADGIAIHQVE